MTTTIEIDGTERDWDAGTLTITRRATEPCAIEVAITDVDPQPAGQVKRYQTIVVKKNAVVDFSGYVMNAPVPRIGPNGEIRWEVRGLCQMWLAVKRKVVGEWEEELTGKMVVDLVDNYLVEEGVQYGTEWDSRRFDIQQTQTPAGDGAVLDLGIDADPAGEPPNLMRARPANFTAPLVASDYVLVSSTFTAEDPSPDRYFSTRTYVYDCTGDACTTGGEGAVRLGDPNDGAPVVAGNSYTAHAWVVSATGLFTFSFVRMRVAWYDSGGAYISSTGEQGQILVGVRASDGGFHHVASLSAVAPTGAVTALAEVAVSGQTGGNRQLRIGGAAIYEQGATLRTDPGAVFVPSVRLDNTDDWDVRVLGYRADGWAATGANRDCSFASFNSGVDADAWWTFFYDGDAALLGWGNGRAGTSIKFYSATVNLSGLLTANDKVVEFRAVHLAATNTLRFYYRVWGDDGVLLFNTSTPAWTKIGADVSTTEEPQDGTIVAPVFGGFRADDTAAPGGDWFFYAGEMRHGDDGTLVLAVEPQSEKEWPDGAVRGTHDLEGETLTAPIGWRRRAGSAASRAIDSDEIMQGINHNIAGGVRLSHTFSYPDAATALDWLAERAQYFWHIEDDKRMLYRPVALAVAPFDADAENVYQPAGEQGRRAYRNVQWLLGGTTLDTPRVETFAGDGERRSWRTASPIGATPTIEVNTVAQTIGIFGIDDGRKFYWNKDSELIVQDDGEAVLGATDTLEITYRPERPMVVRVEDAAEVAAVAAITGASGKIEEANHEPWVRGATAGQTVGESYIAAFAARDREIAYSTWQDGVRPGMRQTVNFPELDLVGTFIVEEVVEEYGGGEHVMYRVRATEAVSLTPAQMWRRLGWRTEENVRPPQNVITFDFTV